MNVFPALPGLAWSVTKAPRFASRIQRSVSGRELRLLDQPAPTWTFTLSYEFLRDAHDARGSGGLGPGYDELRNLMGFFLQQQGVFQPFLFDDPSDDAVTGQVLATTDGATAGFQLVRSMLGFGEPIVAPNVVSKIYVNGVIQSPSSYSINPNTGMVTFTSPPPGGRTLSADFTYYFRCRFADDVMEFENFMYQLWSAKKVSFVSVLN